VLPAHVARGPDVRSARKKQSNMAGRGGLVRKPDNTGWIWNSGLLSLEEKALTEKADAGVSRLSADLRLEPAREPLHWDMDIKKTCGIGPGLVFARCLRTMMRNRHVILVPCAVGGTRMDEWDAQGDLYTGMLRRFAAARRQAAMAAGVLWYQGESDALHEADAMAYECKLLDFLTRLRGDVGERIVVVIVSCSSSPESKLPFVDIVRQAQRTVCGTLGLPCVDTQGSLFLEDGVHLASPSVIRLGQQLAEVFYAEFES